MNDYIKKYYHKNGFVKISNVFTNKEISDLNKSIFDNLKIFSRDLKYIDSKKKYSIKNLNEYLNLIYKNDKKIFSKLYTFLQNYINIYRLSSKKKLLKIISNLLNVSSNSLLMGDLTLRLDNPGRSNAHLDFHQESFFYPKIKNYDKSILIWFPTHKIKKNGGGLSLKLGSHRKGKLKFKFKSKNFRRIKVFDKIEKNVKTFTGNSGSILACNFNVLHGSSKNEFNNFRITCAFRYFSSETKNFIPFKKKQICN